MAKTWKVEDILSNVDQKQGFFIETSDGKPFEVVYENLFYSLFYKDKLVHKVPSIVMLTDYLFENYDDFEFNEDTFVLYEKGNN